MGSLLFGLGARSIYQLLDELANELLGFEGDLGPRIINMLMSLVVRLGLG